MSCVNNISLSSSLSLPFPLVIWLLLPFDDVVGVAVSNVGLVTAVAMAAADEKAPPLYISYLHLPRDDDIRSLVAAGVPVVTGWTSMSLSETSSS